ncbi:MAG: hypothetical protein H2045_13020 [Rhizobiales bacterium]|nr:hypothetical protein [Hyphomicrobiales bacterium]
MAKRTPIQRAVEAASKETEAQAVQETVATAQEQAAPEQKKMQAARMTLPVAPDQKAEFIVTDHAKGGVCGKRVKSGERITLTGRAALHHYLNGEIDLA